MATSNDQNTKLVAALRSALKKNERLREELDRAPEPIAIVGMGCRLPGGIDTPGDLWELLERGGEAMGPLPSDRGWDIDALLGTNGEEGGSAMAQGAFLDDPAAFDPAFFGISPREAEAMDPQQRLLLEVAWEAVEHAGIAPASLAGGDTGVWVGAIAQEYGPRLTEAPGDGFAITGTTNSVASGRLSYVLGLTGPAVTVDTACSSSLVAVHLAVRALRADECSLALAGGATVMATPGVLTEFTHLRGLASDGRCKAFGAGADGAGFSEGAGMVALERLSDARRNGHRVLAVIRGGAVNQDGASNGLTAPNGPSQERVIARALEDARLAPAEVDLVEAHGTGTALGDPIEAQALISAYGRDRADGHPLWLGSLKSNLGHPQAAAGVAGLIKLVLALRHGVLPRTLHAEERTPHVDWSSGAVELLTEARTWPETGHPRRAAVSSFGMSGTNAHLILEQAPPEERSDVSERDPEDTTATTEADPTVRPVTGDAPGGTATAGPVLWPLSARSGAALAAQAARLRERVASDPGLGPVDVGWSLATTRTAFDHRAVVLGGDRADLLDAARALAEGRPAPAVVTGRAVPDRMPVLVFPGQGGQWEGMAVDLLESSPVFAERIGACERALAPFVDWSLSAVLRGEKGTPSLERVDVVQPVLWAVMVALAELWRSYGLRPSAVVGHSQGEVAAACVSGALSLEDGAKVVALRSRAVLELSGTGAMASVALPEARVREDLEAWAGRLHVAVVNSPSSTVFAGETEAVVRLVKEYEESGVRARKIAVDYASHTPHVERLRESLASSLSGVVSRRPEVPFYSALTGRPVSEGELDAAYWYRNLAEPVLFQAVTENLLADGHDLFVEAGPHPVLSTALQETAEAAGRTDAVAMGTLRRDEGGHDRFLASLAQAYAHGAEVDWTAVFGQGARVVDLPTYPFQRQRYWRSPASAAGTAPSATQAPDGAAAPAAPGAWRLPPGLSAAEREDAVLALVRAETAAVLGHTRPEEVDPGRGFLDAGGTSLGAVQLRNRLNELTGLDLPVTVVLDHPTAPALTRHLADRLAEASGADLPPLPVLDELERLETALAASAVDDGTRRELGDRLRGMLRRLDDPSTGTDIDGATDDQLLDLIDQEFGIS
ncbi:acyltransferase domain-containing protein [Nocardiopsis sp. CT-R113]|uniref:Acyltransferase domain-containing protein n=1 Tax=Nocardiopsis codii TaxID=3065942 RepID=A0ABU7K0T3_9ACTN|nr:acyltransferase domain-containing protein [Nocardiopsis sp. CT-R113]MEE2035870.1 acyltransferase domain-containing protein [Nocardiopsis sp. CT-R113]